MNSCKDNYTICSIRTTVSFQGGFYNFTGNQANQKPAILFSLQELDGRMIYTDNQNVNFFLTELTGLKDTIHYKITLSPTLSPDTLSVIYSSQSVVTSPNCDNINNYTIGKSYSTSNTIDSVAVVDPAVNGRFIENIRVYY